MIKFNNLNNLNKQWQILYLVHLSNISLDSIQSMNTENDPLIYNPVVNIPKETTSIKQSNFAWINDFNKASITSFSFLTKKNQEKNM